MKFIHRILSFFIPDKKTENTYSNTTAPVEIIKTLQASKTSPWSEKNMEFYLQLEDRYYQYFIGVNSLLEVDLSSFEINVIKSLEETILEEHSLSKDIPRLPSIVPKLLHLLKTDDFNWKEIADLIASDPVILIEIIKVANSSAYNLKVNEEPLEHIISKIGLLEIRVTIVKVALKPIMLFEGGHFLKHSGTKIWDHAVNTAVACRTLASIYKYDQFDAYLAGILNNLGMVIVVKKMNKIKDFTIAPRSLQFQKKLLNLSKQLSIKIAENWEMRPNIIQALTEQLHSDVRKIETPLGDIIFEANSVSMEHILTNKNLWEKKEIADKKDDYTPFEKAYKALDNL
ncbi:MAG: HDOD domain-containing protein [Gammaproteobacteria bacterium]|nr:HDOD domain-containing protein [Gammaproteobacteria bacterium]